MSKPVSLPEWARPGNRVQQVVGRGRVRVGVVEMVNPAVHDEVFVLWSRGGCGGWVQVDARLSPVAV